MMHVSIVPHARPRRGSARTDTGAGTIATSARRHSDFVGVSTILLEPHPNIHKSSAATVVLI
jgi:hypothetical protein